MAVTNTTTGATAIATKYKQDITPGLRREDVFGRFASVKPIVKGEGNTYIANRVLRLPRLTSNALSETTTTTTPKALTTNSLKMAPGITGDTVQFTKAVMLYSLLKENDIREELKDQIVASRAYLCAKEFSRYALHHRIDYDTSYEVSGTATGGSATTLIDTARTEADDVFGSAAGTPGYVAFTGPEGNNFGMSALVSDWVNSTTTATIAGSQTLQQSVDTTSKYHMVRGTGLVSTDVLTLVGINRTVMMLRKMKAPAWAGGIFYGLIDTEQMYDLYNDTTYQTIMKYSKPSLLSNFAIIPVLDTQLVVADDCIYREAATGAESTTGDIHNALIFGKDAFQVTRWGQDGIDDFGVQIDIFGDKPDSGNYYGLQRWMSWHCFYALAVLDSTRIISLMTGATAAPVTV